MMCIWSWTMGSLFVRPFVATWPLFVHFIGSLFVMPLSRHDIQWSWWRICLSWMIITMDVIFLLNGLAPWQSDGIFFLLFFIVSLTDCLRFISIRPDETRWLIIVRNPEIPRLETITIVQSSSSSDDDEKETCTICLESLDPPYSQWPGCDHHFHEPCIMPWIHRSHRRCPVCRHPL
jgi:hypothetical protein